MDRVAFESRSLALIALTGYVCTLVFGTIGSMLVLNSYAQSLLFQMGDACGITASVIGARYTGLRAQQVGASAFILMGITHGISLAGSGIAGINQEKSITLIMPMIPAMVLMLWCTMFPVWLRILALIPAALFLFVYLRVVSGGSIFDTSTAIAYTLWNIVEVAWALWMVRDDRKRARSVH